MPTSKININDYTALPEADHEYFPEVLQAIRKSLNLGTLAFSKLLGISRASIRRFENKLLGDHIRPNKHTWNKINSKLMELKYFEVSVKSDAIKQPWESIVLREGLTIPDNGIKTVWRYNHINPSESVMAADS